MTYSEKLKDPQWQRKRLEILNRDGWKCRYCESSKTTLHVHHRYYVSGREPWNYPDWCFVTVCEECHKDYERDYNYGFHEWEVTLSELFPGPFDDGDVELAGEFKAAMERTDLNSSYLLKALKEVLRTGSSLDSEIEKVRQWKKEQWDS